MKYLIAFVTLSFGYCTLNLHAQCDLGIIPCPNSLEGDHGEFFLSGETEIVYSNPEDSLSAAIFNNDLKKFFGVSVKLTPERSQKFNVIELRITKGKNPVKDSYSVSVLSREIDISSSDHAGIFYGLQTLLQMIFPTDDPGKFEIPCCQIEDSPRFTWRGMHLDCSRHFFTPAEVKQYIDYLARYKFNTFHWHLTDDQGWRIEIKQFPKLTETGAWRSGTLIGHYSNNPRFDTIRYGGYYTQEEIKEIVRYAAERFITIIPEMEMPGHCTAALAAYPEFGCTGEKIEVAKNWGVFDDVFCPKEETFAFLDSVLSEVMQLFPSKYIHIGGDEAPKTQWRQSEYCQQLMAREGLKDEHELQSYFTQRIEKFVNSRGRSIIGWDEILEGGLAPNAAVMSWRGKQGGIDAASQNHYVVMSPTEFCYFDYYQSKDADEPLAIGGYLPVEKVYAFDPVPEDLSLEKHKFILGGQGNVWTEYIPTFTKLQYMIFPRLCAMSEALWSKPVGTSQKEYDFTNFKWRLVHYHFKWFDQQRISYSKAVISPRMITGRGKNEKGLRIGVSNIYESARLFYSLDGSYPSIAFGFDSAINISRDATVAIRVLDEENGIDKILKQDFKINKATGKKYSLYTNPSQKYSGTGFTLTDGINGRIPWHGEEWLGFSGSDLEVKFDFGETLSFHTITLGVLEDLAGWVYLPQKVTVMSSVDGIHFTPVASKEADAISRGDHRHISIETGTIDTRYLVIRAENFGTIPDGNAGSGNAAWLFVDEIMIE